MVNLTVNGETRRFEAPLSVAQLLARLDLDARKIALERNLEIVPRSSYDRIMLGEGDRIEIVHFIGGGNRSNVVAAPEPGAEGDLVVAGLRFSLAADRRDRKVSRLRADPRRGRGLRSRAGHRRRPPRQHRRSEPADAGRLPRPQEIHLPSQHRRLLQRRRGGADAAVGARGRRLELGEARGPGRPEDPVSQHDRDPARRRDAARRGFRGHGLLQ